MASLVGVRQVISFTAAGLIGVDARDGTLQWRVPLNTRLALGEFAYYLEDSTPKAIFFDENHQSVVEKVRSEARTDHAVCFDRSDVVGRSLASLWGGLPSEAPPEVDLGPSDPQLIIYTSGTTGVPKGVILTHGMITWNSINTYAHGLCVKD